MQFGTLQFTPVAEKFDLVAAPIQERIAAGEFADGVFVAATDPDVADTAAFCETYDVTPEASANCIIVEAKRGERTWYAACMVLASDMLDVNGKVRRHLDARKISFAAKDTALALTHMEYGGVTPLGLPADLPILIDEKVMRQERVIIGSGLRRSKILVHPIVLSQLESATVMDVTK